LRDNIQNQFNPFRMTNKPLKWGILSAAKICNDFLAAMTTLPDGENLPVAIAARSKVITSSSRIYSLVKA
jgi:hypothetical protein